MINAYNQKFHLHTVEQREAEGDWAKCDRVFDKAFAAYYPQDHEFEFASFRATLMFEDSDLVEMQRLIYEAGLAAGDDLELEGVNEFKARVTELSNENLFEFLNASLSWPGIVDTQAFWVPISVLRSRGDLSIFDKCCDWATDASAVRRQIAAHVLGELGHNSDRPFLEASQPILERQIADSDSGVVSAALNSLDHLRADYWRSLSHL
jgi:hypothetical protein